MPLLDMPALAWLVLAILAAILEVSTPHFGSIFVTAGAIAAAAAAYLGFGIPLQLMSFVVMMTTSVVFLRSRLLGSVGGPGVPSRTAPLIGRQGVVTHDVDTVIGTGRVNVGGEDWAARSSEPIPTGTRVRVTGADGIVLEVTRA
jgi:membrane protein implicated in regulation of membrane protease activity